MFFYRGEKKNTQLWLPKDGTIPETAPNVMRKTVTTAKNGTKASSAATAAATILTNSGLNVPEQDGRTNSYKLN